MKLTIYSLKGAEFIEEAKAFVVKTKSGEITVLDHHRPLISALEKGKARIIKPDGAIIEKEINSGFLEVMPGSRVDVLIN